MKKPVYKELVAASSRPMAGLVEEDPMFDLDGEVRRWREQQERASSLSVRELDELEDHLRIRVDLELELNAGLTPARAFAIARDELGAGSALSKEFAKAGAPTCRRLLGVGWMMFGASFLLPMMRFEFTYESVTQVAWLKGYYAFWHAFTGGEPQFVVPTLAMLATLAALPRRGTKWTRPMVWVLAASALYSSILGLSLNLGADSLQGMSAVFHVGYFVRVASLACAAAGLWIRAREWAPAAVRSATGS